MSSAFRSCFLFLLLPCAHAAALAPLPGAASLAGDRDFPAEMIAGIARHFEGETGAVARSRVEAWRALLSRPPVERDVALAELRKKFARTIGAVDPRVANVEVELLATTEMPALVAENVRVRVFAVRWPVLEGVFAEGLMLEPLGGAPVARVVALPDADQTPEMLAGLAPGLPAERQFALRLAENGCLVLVPALVSREGDFSGNPRLGLRTSQPHREWIYRQAFVLGRHIIGYEVQKILAAVDWFARRPARAPIGVAGWGEGGLLALHAAALDPRIDAALVSGYFGPRERLWEEPIYRNLLGVLRDFGDAELARLVAPRALLIEPAAPPELPPRTPGPVDSYAGAPGRFAPIAHEGVRAEFQRARDYAGVDSASLQLLTEPRGALGVVAQLALLRALRAPAGPPAPVAALVPNPSALRHPVARQERTVRELERHAQRLLALAPEARDAFFWKPLAPIKPAAWPAATRPLREKFWKDYLGRIPIDRTPANPRSRPLLDRPAWTGHEVQLDVAPDIFAWGYLLLPKNLRPGEHRPVVVVQHGVGGHPDSTITEDPASRAFQTYRAFGARLAERGFVVFAPQNPYLGDDPSRTLQRRANPVGQTIFAVIVAQHQRILEWLGALPFVDSARIGFYGLSYGGQTAMRVPVVLDNYAVTICSGDFNEWTIKNVTTGWPFGYMFKGAYERPDFDFGNTFGYGELAALIAPRPFMVERGHHDNVGLDEFVAFEYAKVRRLYDRLGLADRTAIEFFDGPHTIHGVGTFQFLHRHLDWPEPGPAAR